MDKPQRASSSGKMPGLNPFCTTLVKFVTVSNYMHCSKTTGTYQLQKFCNQNVVVHDSSSSCILVIELSAAALSLLQLHVCIIVAIIPFFYRYAHFLPDHEFPLLKMKEPSLVNGKYYFPETRIKVSFGKRCMTCGKMLKAGPAISCK